jgi:hypothetical protein
MSVESYVDSVRPHLAERDEKVRTVVDMLRRIVLKHAEFDGASLGSPMVTPSARWSPDTPNVKVWLSLFGLDGGQIDRADVVGIEDWDLVVGSADFEVSDGWAAIAAMTIEVQPPNVKSYDGSPLTPPQLDGAIADMKRYEDALINGNVGE